jgi:hypothetical protein
LIVAFPYGLIIEGEPDMPRSKRILWAVWIVLYLISQLLSLSLTGSRFVELGDSDAPFQEFLVAAIVFFRMSRAFMRELDSPHPPRPRLY